MTCVTCKHWELKKSTMARDGFAPCALGNRWENWSANHTCQKLEVVKPEMVKARSEWFAKIDKK